MQRLAVALIFLTLFSLFAGFAVIAVRRSAAQLAEGMGEGETVPRIAYMLLIALMIYVAVSGFT